MKYFIPLFTILLAACGNPQSTEESAGEAEVTEEIMPAEEIVSAEEPVATIVKEEKVLPFQVLFEPTDSKGDPYPTIGLISPDGTKELIFEEVDPTAMSLSVKKGTELMEIQDLYASSENAAWSMDSRYALIVDDDMYAGSGALGFTILDAETGQYLEKSLDDFTEGMDLEGRSSFRVYNQGGLNEPGVFVFSISVNYLGESGHPGIDSNRRTELGDNFGKDDVILIGHFKATMVSEGDDQLSVSPVKEESTESESAESFEGVVIGYEETGIYGTWSLEIKKENETETVIMNYFSEGDPGEIVDAKSRIFFTRMNTNSLVNMLHEGVLLDELSEYSDTTGLPHFTGILKGTEYATGDTPTNFAVVDASDNVLPFNDFIYENMIPLTEKVVTVYYNSRTEVNITRIEKLE